MTTARSTFTFMLATLAFAFILNLIYFVGVAHADPALDPIVVAQASVDGAWGTIATYGWLWGGALIAYAGIGAFLRRNESAGWLTHGRTLAMVTAASMLLLAVLTWKFHGHDSAGLLMSLFMAIKLLVNPSVERSSQTGSAGLVVMAGLAVVGLVVACGARQRVANAVDAFIDCQEPNIVAALPEVTPLAKQALEKWISGSGTIDLAGMKSVMISAKSDLFRCGIAAAVAALSAETKQGDGAAALAVNPDQLRMSFVVARDDLGWVPVRLPSGAVL